LLCLSGAVVLLFAALKLMFAGAATPGFEMGEKVRGALLALLGVALVGRGIYMCWRASQD